MIYFKGYTLHQCLIRLPEEHLLNESYPLVVGLHGGGSNPDTLINLWDSIPNRNFIYSVPQGPYPFVEDGELKFDWAMWPSQDEALIQKATALSEQYILDAVQAIKNLHPVSGTYLMGFSQGAIFTYIVGIKYHHIFDGLICLSGPGLLTPLKNSFVRSVGADWLPVNFIQGAKNLRVLITHGKNDLAANYELGLKSKDVLEKHGYDVTFYEFDGGHTTPPAPLLRSIAQWITA